MLSGVGSFAIDWAKRVDPWTNVYGLARTFIALAALLTLLFNPTTTMFHPAVGIPTGLKCGGEDPLGFGLFCMPLNLEVLRWLAIAGLALVASGWRPRITGVLHWWIQASLFWNAVLVDGGEQISMVLTLLLVPVTLLDSRKWHWSRREVPTLLSDGELARRLMALVALVGVRVQMAVVYFHASAGKLKVEEWVDGSVLYYWFGNDTFGAAGLRRDLLWPIITQPALAAMMTWGVLVGEALLAGGVLVNRRYWKYFLWTGLLFHFGIIVAHGLPAFAMAMWAGLTLMYRPVDRPYDFASWLRMLDPRRLRSS